MESLHDLWQQVIEEIKEKITDVSYDVWIKPLAPLEVNSKEVVLLAPTSFHKNIVVDQFTMTLENAFQLATGLPIMVRVTSPEEVAPQSGGEDEIYTYTFDNFIVGSSNQFAHAASQAVAQKPGGAYNPLFIYGASGMGKTHLLLAISNEIKRKNPGMTIVYIKGDQFTNELIEALRDGNQKEFRKKYRYADVLLVDDVQFIGGRISTQEEFFHTFNELYQERKQIVLTSDRPPREIATLEDRLRSRFENGLLADIAPPEFETRIAIVKRKAQQINLDLNDEICTFIAMKLKSNIRQLEGVVKKINVVCMVDKEKPSIVIAQNAIKDILSDVQPLPITIDRIISEVARSNEVTPDDIRSDKRSSQISMARQIAMYAVREITGLPFKAIGQEFGGKDHTTVIYSVQQIKAKMKKQPEFRASVEDMIKNIKNN